MKFALTSFLRLIHNPGLYPTDYLEAAKCDAILGSTGDMYMRFSPMYVEKDEARKVRQIMTYLVLHVLLLVPSSTMVGTR